MYKRVHFDDIIFYFILYKKCERGNNTKNYVFG